MTKARSVQLEDDELPYRKGSSATIRSEGTGTEYYSKRGMLESYDSTETIRASRPVSTVSNSSMRVRRLSSLTDDNTRFPKLQDCAHFHYDTVEITSLKISLTDEDHDIHHGAGDSVTLRHFYCRISSNKVTWLVRRTFQNFCMLDQKLHRCIFDRKFSHLPDLNLLDTQSTSDHELKTILADYLVRFSSLSGSMLNCGSVLNWLEIDNRGNRLLAVDDSGINTPAIAAAHAIKRYTAQAADEISLEVGDIISVIDMPPSDDTVWWRGKRGFEVGFFPHECVEVIGDKVPAAVVSSIPETPQNRALLKKHGKFISFLRLFFNTRPARIQLKQSGIVKERVFGCDLGEHLLNSGHDVPLVLKSCADVIESHGLVDGIYRLSGISSNIQKLRLAFDEDRVPDLTSEEYLQDVHSISSLLKMYFRELPNPLLTYQLYDKFADAVRDEENKLLRIHDVVQQLPPPHYRTTEYLMRHLSRVAAHGHNTGMHSKNLAIVWAPNLLRSKELETGGGAAALRGVGIQAVVTEFLILYAEIIFSDKMPAYSSPELKKGHKKPRPKSLAISTPTRLLTLEEARERALLGNICNKQDQKFIDVGGGPQNLPAKYHTVLDLPGYKKKSTASTKDAAAVAAATKGKKSPGGGLKSLFSRSRSGSIRQKGRKPSIHDSLNFEPGERKAITEEDVQHWKRRRIRSAKSAESLLSLPVTSRLGSPLTESLDPNRLMNILSGKDPMSPTKAYRALSIEPRPLTSSQEYSVSYPSFILEESGGREMAIDVNPEDIDLVFSKTSPSTDSPDDSVRRKQSFVRDDKKRKVICHRRTPSAPSTPRHERHGSSDCYDDGEEGLERDRSVSQPMLEGPVSSKPPRGTSTKYLRQESDPDQFYTDSLVPDFSLRNGDDNGSEKRKGSKTPPKDRKKLKEENGGMTESQIERVRHGSGKENVDVTDGDGLIEELPESPGSRRKVRGTSVTKHEVHTGNTTHYLYSRHHDYAEIDDNELQDNADRQPVQDKLSESGTTRRYKVEHIVRGSSVESQTSSEKLLETEFPAHSEMKKPYASSDSINSAKSSHADADKGLSNPRDALFKEISSFEKGLESLHKQYSENSAMSKCMSIPSDIQKSLENILSAGGSHSDLMSSVTISELSMSQDNVSSEESSGSNDRRRRSISLDGLSDESPLSRTLREINAQIDQAFKSEKLKTQSLRDLQQSPSTPKGSCVFSSSDLMNYEDELAVTPTGQRSFGSMRDTDMLPHSRSSSFEGRPSDSQNKFVDRPAAEIHIADAPKVIRAPLRSNKESSTVISPTRPSPPDSLDITSSAAMQAATKNKTSLSSQNTSSDVSPYSNVDSKTGFRLSEEDFQKLLMSDPDSMRQFEQSMLYSPVRSRHKGSDGERSNRSSVMSPVDGMYTRSTRSNRSSLASPEASPSSFVRQVQNRSFGSPEVSPQSSRSQHSQSSSEASPQSRHNNIKIGSAEASPQTGSRHLVNQSFSSSESSPQTGYRYKHNQSYSSSEASPQMGARPKQSYSSGSPQVDKRYGQSPKGEKKRTDVSGQERRPSTHSSPKINEKKASSLVSSPLSPEHKQPRWEDLACLNDSFNELDLAVFNDNWKKCLAPTGDSIRQSKTNVSDSCEQLSAHNEFPEVSTGTDTVVIERPSITRKTEEKVNAKHKHNVGEIETYDNVPETFLMQQGSRPEEKGLRADRPAMKRSNTVPASSSVPQSPTLSQSGSSRSSFFETSTSTVKSGLVRGVSFESTANISASANSSPVIRKSRTTPALTRQRSFDSSYRTVRVTNLGRSFDDSIVRNPDIVVKVRTDPRPGKGAYIAVTANTGGGQGKSSNQKASFSVTAHHGNQSVLIRSESNQSCDVSFPEPIQPNRQESSSLGSLIPQMLEEMDVNESCLGLASHQNMSNEMKEMMQEQMKNHAGILSPLDDVMAPFSNVTSPLSQQVSFFDTSHPLAGFDMESSIEVPNEIPCVDLPEVNIQYLSEGPTLIANSNVLSRLSSPETSQIIHQPIDNSEEEFQNAVNDDLERNLASLTEFLPQHVSVCEPSDKLRQSGDVILLQQCAGAEIMDTPDPVTQDSVSTSSSSSMVDSMTSSFTYPQSFDSRHYYSPRVNSLNIQGDLAPPPLEMIEICKSVLVRAKPPSGRKTETNPNLKWEYPKVLKDAAESDVAEKSKKASATSRNAVLERGEEKLVLDNRPSLKKGVNTETKSKLPRRQLIEMTDSDHGENSGTEDEVFVDPSEVTPNTNFFAASSKYFKRRDFLSYDYSQPGNRPQDSTTADQPKEPRRFAYDNMSRCSMDESMMQMVSTRHDDLVAKDLLSGYHDDLMDIGHETEEDIRFSKAHRSSKLLSLCERFESGSGQSLNSDEEEAVATPKQKIITPPEKNIVSSIRQMHESLEFEKKEPMETKGQKSKKFSLDECKSPKEEKKSFSPSHLPVRENSFSSDPNKGSSSGAGVKTADPATPQGKPPKYKKTRTPSESSLSENEGFKGTPKGSKVEGSPKSKYDGSPKGHRQSLVSSDEGSPKLLPTSGSPKGQRFSTEVSPKVGRGREGSQVMLRQSAGSPKGQRAGEGNASKIPIAKQGFSSKVEDKHTDEGSKSQSRFSGSPKGLRNSANETSPKSSIRSEKSEIKTHRLRKAESVEERYNLQFERESPSRVHFEDEPVGRRNNNKNDKDAEEKKKRRGSIKELTNVFEEKIENLARSATQSPPQGKLRSRVRSVSPNSLAAKTPSPVNVRHSCEIMPPLESSHKASDSNLKQQSVRVGPKPFYGAKQ